MTPSSETDSMSLSSFEQSRPSTVLIVCSDVWMGRSFSSVFEEHRFEVVRAINADEALSAARRVQPDVVVLDDCPGAVDAIAICRALQAEPQFDPSCPTVITAAPHLASKMRLEAYRAGAWEYCSQPVDLELLMLKLKTFLRAHQSLADARAECTVDRDTGLYTAVGLRHAAEKMLARASRTHGSITCLAITPRPNDGMATSANAEREDKSALARTVALCRAQSRESDVLGRVAGTRLALLAPDTDGAGARIILSRLQGALDDDSRTADRVAGFRLLAGYCVLRDIQDDRIGGAEFVRRAEMALERLQSGPREARLLGFEDLPPS